MDNPGFLQSAVGKIGEFFQWLKEKMEDDQVRRDTLIDLGLDPDKDAKLKFLTIPLIISTSTKNQLIPTMLHFKVR